MNISKRKLFDRHATHPTLERKDGAQRGAVIFKSDTRSNTFLSIQNVPQHHCHNVTPFPNAIKKRTRVAQAWRLQQTLERPEQARKRAVPHPHLFFRIASSKWVRCFMRNSAISSGSTRFCRGVGATSSSWRSCRVEFTVSADVRHHNTATRNEELSRTRCKVKLALWETKALCGDQREQRPLRGLTTRCVVATATWGSGKPPSTLATASSSVATARTVQCVSHNHHMCTDASHTVRVGWVWRVGVGEGARGAEGWTNLRFSEQLLCSDLNVGCRLVLDLGHLVVLAWGVSLGIEGPSGHRLVRHPASLLLHTRRSALSH